MTDKTNPLPGLLQMAVNSIARHILTGVAGGLLAAGYISKVQDAQLITGGAAVVVWLAGVGWSILEKKETAKAVAPPATAE